MAVLQYSMCELYYPCVTVVSHSQKQLMRLSTARQTIWASVQKTNPPPLHVATFKYMNRPTKCRNRRGCYCIVVYVRDVR